ncbi:MAG: hypothetical protein HKP12_13915, partial [Gammaproteobacteria bacterium]|nr:hypothetical protein [Gammaproteobacteria bacterium]
KALQEQIKKASDIDKTTQEQILGIYSQALEQLELAAEWAAKARLDKLATAHLTIASPLDQAQDVTNRVRRYALAKEIDA